MSKWGEMTAEYEWGFEKGVDTERERIIKLLESIRVSDHWIGRDYAIDLIKGSENVGAEIDNMSEGKQ